MVNEGNTTLSQSKEVENLQVLKNDYLMILIKSKAIQH